MYSNIGKKIMTLAVIIAVITMLASCAFGIYLMIEDETAIGAVTMIFGPIVCWILGFFLYGFGRLIDNSDYIARKMGRRDGFGIPDTKDSLDWSATEDDDDADDSIPTPHFVAHRIVKENRSYEPQYCSACGSKLDGANTFCTRCGTPIE